VRVLFGVGHESSSPLILTQRARVANKIVNVVVQCAASLHEESRAISAISQQSSGLRRFYFLCGFYLTKAYRCSTLLV
jgi:hypothetical protein